MCLYLRELLVTQPLGSSQRFLQLLNGLLTSLNQKHTHTRIGVGRGGGWGGWSSPNIFLEGAEPPPNILGLVLVDI